MFSIPGGCWTLGSQREGQGLFVNFKGTKKVKVQLGLATNRLCVKGEGFSHILTLPSRSSFLLLSSYFPKLKPMSVDVDRCAMFYKEWLSRYFLSNWKNILQNMVFPFTFISSQFNHILRTVYVLKYFSVGHYGQN